MREKPVYNVGISLRTTQGHSVNVGFPTQYVRDTLQMTVPQCLRERNLRVH